MPIKDPIKRRIYYRKYMNERREIRKIKAIEYKGGKCIKCGYSKCIASLTFHHEDPKQKEFNIGSKDVGWNKVKEELDKCFLLCANCHNELEYNLYGNRSREEGI